MMAAIGEMGIGFFRAPASLRFMAQYTVQPGDNPSKIAREFGMTLADFVSLNPDLCDFGTNNCRVIFPGQIVNVGGQDTQQPSAAAPTGFNAPPPWMQIAIMEQGVQEWGQGDNPRILEYLRSCSISGSMLRDETAWCAAFVNWCVKNAGFKGSGSARVSDWWTWGRSVVPTYGAICVMQPLTVDQASSGHIGFLHAMEGDNVWLLSGNSKNQVRIAAYPKNKLVQNGPYRWPF
jgi:uncharacterized protein (TIGR02594 family)